MENNTNSQSGWGQYFTSSLGLVVTSLGCGTVATVATISGAPFVAAGFATVAAVTLNAFVVKELITLKKANEGTTKKLKQKYEPKKVEEMREIHNQLGDPERANGVANVGITSGTLGILSGLASPIVAVKTSLQDPNNPDPSLKNWGIALAVTGGAAILTGFTVLTVLGNRAGKLKDKLFEVSSQPVTHSGGSEIELHKQNESISHKR